MNHAEEVAMLRKQIFMLQKSCRDYREKIQLQDLMIRELQGKEKYDDE